ncbi:lipocalin family protein [Altibacter sp. HG106]|uniref:lipocalin family protein n=1 Tax=Altibacter sp. HG106 TaxID=3023937 RepID=UPI0023501F0C|nr:lipocalin family protein [Altibacter sp. HG106]MDC7995553.1 lipocalin family protein [Altibacter sp. HG106]
MNTIHNLLLCFFLVLFVSCGSEDPETMIPYIEGYWEIKEVTLDDGSVKSFRVNTTIDYIERTDREGFRKKLQPNLDGSFRTSNLAESFTLSISEDSLRMHYTTPYDSWTETVLQAEDSLLQVLNRDGKIYTYQKFRTFSNKLEINE